MIVLDSSIGSGRTVALLLTDDWEFVLASEETSTLVRYACESLGHKSVLLIDENGPRQAGWVKACPD